MTYKLKSLLYLIAFIAASCIYYVMDEDNKQEPTVVVTELPEPPAKDAMDSEVSLTTDLN